MSYCSKCGVELLQTEDVCPLCGTRIHEESGYVMRAYPSNYEAVPLRCTHIALMGLIILLLPALCCVTVDFLQDGLISWALYICGAEACIFTYAFLPRLFLRPKSSVCIIISSIVTVGYFFLIGHLSGSAEWVLPLGLPMTILSGSTVYAILSILKMKKVTHLLKSAVIISMSGLFIMAVEAVIDINKHGIPTLQWALPVLLPIVCISAALFYIEYDSELKNRLQRAVFLVL